MPLGKEYASFPVPVAGIIRDRAPQDVPPSGMIDGQNMFVDIDGILKPRSGYSPLVASGPGGRIMGGIGMKDIDTTLRYVVANETQWWQFDGTSWNNITDGANPQTGGADNLARFIAFGQASKIWAVGCDDVDPMRRWNASIANYQTIVAAPICRDLCAVGSRILVVNTTEGGVRYAYRVRWSAVNDATTWPALATNDLLDTDEPFVGCRTFGRTSAALYGENSIWMAVGQSGNDATAFRFEQVPGQVIGPISPAAIVPHDGVHDYLGRDFKIYRFDGVQAYPISGTIDSVLRSDIASGFPNRIHGAYDPAKKQLRFFYVSGSDSDPKHAVVFNVAGGRFEPIETYTEGITASFGAETKIGYTWNNWVAASTTWPMVPYASWDSIPSGKGLSVLIGTAAGQVHTLGASSQDNGVAIPYNFQSYLYRKDPSRVSLPDRMFLFLKKRGSSENVQVTLSALSYPAATPVALFDKDVDVSDDSQFSIADPLTVNPGDYAFLQLKLSGMATTGGLAFGGADLFVNPEQRT